MMDRRGFLSFCLASCCCWLSKLMNISLRREEQEHTKTPARLRLEEFWAEDR